MKMIKKTISLIIIIVFIGTNSIYAAPSSRSLFKNKRVDYKKLSTQSEQQLQKKRSILNDKDGRAHYRRQKARKVLASHLQDLSNVHIPSELGRIIEVYQAPIGESRTTNDPVPLASLGYRADKRRLVIHIQDLHTNPEAQFNLAKILELLLKNYHLDLVCSEGADEIVDTSSVSSFPSYMTRDKVARFFINTGELTGEEYLSITKYPDLPIWGVEDRDIYFKNIIQFNNIMKFSPQAQIFISQTKKALSQLKNKIYSKELLALDQKETDYEDEKIETDEYLNYITDYIQKFNIPTYKYKNITLLQESIEQEKNINSLKAMEASQKLLLNLRIVFLEKGLREDVDSLMVSSEMFYNQKISAFSFYTYLKNLALEHMQDGIEGYPHLKDFTVYLAKVNSLDSTSLFNEMEDLTYEVKMRFAKNEDQRLFIKAQRNIKFLEGFFNLKVSNEELDYYLENKESHKVAWFKSTITNLTNKTNSTKQTNYIDFNPELIDGRLQEMEDFYKIVKARDVAMVENSISEIKKRDAKVAALIAGGFHTKGITRLLRDRGYSYIVVSPASSTDLDEENYHNLLAGKRTSLIDVLKHFGVSKSIRESDSTLRSTLVFDFDMTEKWNKQYGEKYGKIEQHTALVIAETLSKIDPRAVEDRRGDKDSVSSPVPLPESSRGAARLSI